MKFGNLKGKKSYSNCQGNEFALRGQSTCARRSHHEHVLRVPKDGVVEEDTEEHHAERDNLLRLFTGHAKEPKRYSLPRSSHERKEGKGFRCHRKIIELMVNLAKIDAKNWTKS